MRQWPYVIASYAITWIVLAAYRIHIMRRARAAEAAAAAAGAAPLDGREIR